MASRCSSLLHSLFLLTCALLMTSPHSEGQETDRGGGNEVVDERTRMEMYYPPFLGALKAEVGSIMCSYNRINGDYSCGNNATLNTDLRERLGFEGRSKSMYWFSPRICSRTLMGYSDSPEGGVRSTPSVFSRVGSLRPSSYADARSPDDVTAFCQAG